MTRYMIAFMADAQRRTVTVQARPGDKAVTVAAWAVSVAQASLGVDDPKRLTVVGWRVLAPGDGRMRPGPGRVMYADGLVPMPTDFDTVQRLINDGRMVGYKLPTPRPARSWELRRADDGKHICTHMDCCRP